MSISWNLLDFFEFANLSINLHGCMAESQEIVDRLDEQYDNCCLWRAKMK